MWLGLRVVGEVVNVFAEYIVGAHVWRTTWRSRVGEPASCRLSLVECSHLFFLLRHGWQALPQELGTHDIRALPVLMSPTEKTWVVR